MSVKATLEEETKGLYLRKLPLSLHWKLETWAKSKKVGKEEAAERIITKAMKKVNISKTLTQS